MFVHPPTTLSYVDQVGMGIDWHSDVKLYTILSVSELIILYVAKWNLGEVKLEPMQPYASQGMKRMRLKPILMVVSGFPRWPRIWVCINEGFAGASHVLCPSIVEKLGYSPSLGGYSHLLHLIPGKKS